MPYRDRLRTFLRSDAGFILVAVLVALAAVAVNLPLAPSYKADSDSYAAIALGRISDVVRPFTSSFLHPFLSGIFSAFSGIGLARSFQVFDLVSLAFLLVSLALLLKRTLRWAPLLAALLPIGYYAARLGDTFSPDLFTLALTALFFLALYRGKEWVSLVVLFLLFLTRQSSALLGLVFLVIAFLKSKRTLAVGALVVVAISMVVAGEVSHLGLPNAHHVSDFEYLVLRVPFLALRNVGIVPWVNTLPGTCEPRFTVELPRSPFFGSIREMGLCGFSPQLLLDDVTAALSLFGVLPAALAYILARRWRDIWRNSPPWVLVALAYGVIHFVVAWGNTTGVPRFIGYAWPAFLLASPFLAARYLAFERGALVRLFVFHVAAMWVPLALAAVGSSIPLKLVSLILAAAASVAAVRILRSQPFAPSEPAAGS